jgi:hypothetical protein
MDTQATEFFERIPPITDIKDITHLSRYYDAPLDWYIAITDVTNSTEAIERGKYKDVNAIAAATITALINRVPGIDLPFIFGGDGATILIPPNIVPQAWQALLATEQLAREAFNLELRTGLIPISDVVSAGYSVKVSRLKISDNYSQAIFAGGGTAFAEKLLKDPQTNSRYRVTGTGKYEADFTGFECRWNAIPSPYEETISLIVQATCDDTTRNSDTYRAVLDEIDRIYGDRVKRHPITPQNMRLALNPMKLWIEARIKFNDTSILRLLKMTASSLFAKIAMRTNLGKWGTYPAVFLGATDNEKFDDMLRMIIAGTKAQRETLLSFLDEKRQHGELVYGLHTAKHALVTCIVFDYFGRQVHFIDASDGGYVLAAKAMKGQLQEKVPA